ncbi:hypothetical protein PN499_04920 [Kamptonema animale CS-326]|nr:hypothetical protein [Kamptonema animale CS-326]
MAVCGMQIGDCGKAIATPKTIKTSGFLEQFGGSATLSRAVSP